jgi:hypothetical protein
VSCSKVRRELLEHFRFREELGSSSAPHLAHLERCASCREEVGIDQELVEQLRRALRERVAGLAPSAASWEVVRQRTVDRPQRPLALRLVQWGRVLPAAVAGVIMFAMATAPQAGFGEGAQSPQPPAAAVEAVMVDEAEEATAWEPPWWSKYRAPQPVRVMSGGYREVQMPDEPGSGREMPNVSGPLR